MKRKLDILLTIIFLAGVTYVSFFAGIPLKKANATEEVKKVIVVDAGHGGNDPGKVSGNNVLEKDVNLQIATKLAKECKIPCYGREILEELSRKAGMSVEKLEQYEEDATGSFLYSLYVMTKVQSGDTDYTDLKGKVYIAEQKIIKEFANEGPAIFLGHCAYEALSDRQNVLRVFIYGDEDDKRERISREYGIADSEIDSTMKKFNKKRSNYYKANTGLRWDDYHNYDVVINSSTIGINNAVLLLKGMIG